VDDNSLFVEPLLDRSQIGEVTFDLRLGYDFHVSILTRSPKIELAGRADQRSIGSFFQETRREVGDTFVLYPSQAVLTTSLEYIGLPDNIYMDVITRSSYSRLGLQINSMVQPGFRGCVPIELFNHSNNAVELVVGSRVCQAKLFDVENNSAYTSTNVRKYYGNVRPTLSKADNDEEIKILAKVRKPS
jgi:dCTP deaminase